MNEILHGWFLSDCEIIPIVLESMFVFIFQPYPSVQAMGPTDSLQHIETIIIVNKTAVLKNQEEESHILKF